MLLLSGVMLPFSPLVPVLREKPKTRAGKGTPVPEEIPVEGLAELPASPIAQPVVTMDDAVMALNSLQLEDNPVEEVATVSTSSPDSSQVQDSPTETKPPFGASSGDMSTGSSSGETESLDKVIEVSTVCSF